MKEFIKGFKLYHYFICSILLFYNWKLCLLFSLSKIFKYKNIYKIIKTYYHENIIVINQDGFFSCCSIRLLQINNYIDFFKREPKIIDSSQSFKMYKKNINDEIFDFFEHYNNITHVNIKDNILKYHDMHTQFKNYSNVDYENITPFLKKYFSPSNKINKIINNIEQKYNIRHNNTLSVYYRGTDKYIETQLSPFDEFYQQIIEIVNKNKNIKILLQSDDARFIDYITNKKIKNIFIIEENKTSYSSKGIHNEQTSDENYYDMLNFLSIIIIMSKCKYIICSSGNCSIWMMIYRGNGKNIVQYLEGNWYNSII